MTPRILALILLVATAAQADERPRVRSARDFVIRHGYVTFPEHRPATRPRAPGRLYAVGDPREFWSWDLSIMPPQDVLVPSTCRAVGPSSYVFVADDQWNTNVTQDDVDQVLAALEDQTPAGSINPAQGIIPNEIDVFGPVPDALDADPRAIILLMELRTFQGTQFDGFFNAFNQYTDEYTMAEYGYHSNECEMVTVNAAIRPPASEMTLSILAHEFQHLIHWGGDEAEESWVNESCSEAAMVVNGYLTDIAWMNSYLADPTEPLYSLDHVHYGACLLFGSYLYERFSASFLLALVADTAQGEAGFVAPLSGTGEDLGMDELLLDWATATLGDHLGATDLRYHHPILIVGAPSLRYTIDSYPATGLRAGTLAHTGVIYTRLAAPPGGGDVRVRPRPRPGDALLYRGLMVDADGTSHVFAPDAGEVEFPFSSHPDAGEAYLVMIAYGESAEYNFVIEADGVEEDGGMDAGVDAGEDAGMDAGPDDAGMDAGPEDAGMDAGPEDAGMDAGPEDAGMDAGQDAGSDPGSDPGTDAGSDPGSDSGSDSGSDGGTDPGDDGCGCAHTQSAALPVVFALLGLVFRRRRAP